MIPERGSLLTHTSSRIVYVPGLSRKILLEGAMIRIRIILLVTLCAAISISLKTASASATERFEYVLLWNGLTAGVASLESVTRGDRMELSSTISSTPPISVVYTVNDRVVSIVRRAAGGSGIGLPEKYHITIREGRHSRDREYRFDYRTRLITYIDNERSERAEFALSAPVFDPLSSIYHIRTLPLAVGKSTSVMVFDNKRIYAMEVRVLRREVVRTPAGEFSTIMVHPVMQGEGFFSRKGELYLWLTDDALRMPVQIRSKIKIGTITGQLTKIVR